ncbi:predicted protein [Botrytis cinerea T4]|uniref:Uncharacterized protein n=1 Tax=Botryotinia fuckeliana (strain T4) TaxID=999810 RepID=G2XZ15_BOTF4|nr:predicted protein [Botrytis cinerea T4]
MQCIATLGVTGFLDFDLIMLECAVSSRGFSSSQLLAYDGPFQAARWGRKVYGELLPGAEMTLLAEESH